MNIENIEKFIDWIERIKQKITGWHLVLALAAILLCWSAYWTIEVKCKISDCENDRRSGIDYCLEHSCHGAPYGSPSCPNPHIDGSIYCEEHAYCIYDDCGKFLSSDEYEYCTEHKALLKEQEAKAAEEAHERYKKEQESKAAEEKKREEEKREEIRRKEYRASQRGSYNSYASYDSGYDDVYDGDYDDYRYSRDSGYASGVDDALDEIGDDW